MNPHGFDAVDFHHRQFQLALARGLQALALKTPASAHRQLVEHLRAGFRRGDGPV
jgi:hypothetical protein